MSRIEPLMINKQPCECIHWCSTQTDVLMLTGHHENCAHSPGVLAASKILIEKLVRGIEDWASQEDGIPDDLWDAYVHAKSVLGEPINHDPEASMSIKENHGPRIQSW